MSFGGANINTGWLAGLGPTGTTTTSRIINVGGKILVVGNTSGDFTIQGFQVRGSGDGGQFVICFDASGVVQWVQSPVVGLPIPSAVAVVAQDGRGTVTWSSTAKTLLTGYTVDVSGAGSYAVSGGTTATFDVSGLTNAVTYPVRVRGVNATTQGDYSSTVGLRPMPVPPAPTGLSIATGRRLLDISWNAPTLTFVDGYTIDINGIAYDVSRSAVTRRITGLLTDIPYTVKIRSYNNAYASTYTPSQTVTIPYVAQAPYAYMSIGMGDTQSGAVLADGTVRMWGGGGNGRLGIGSTVDMSTAVTPCNLSNVVSLECGSNHSIALLSDGTVRTWGTGTAGQLGNGASVDMSRVVTPNISGVTAVSAYGHNLVLLEDGTMRAWGTGANGELGNGGSVSQNVPVTPTGVSTVVGIAAGNSASYALLSNGTIRAWGGNANGQLGNSATAASQLTAVTTCNISNAVAIAAGFNHVASLMANGTIMTWGLGSSGQLGNNTTTASQTTPTTVSNISNAVAISCGRDHTAAVLADGTMRAWGLGSSGQLGNGSTASSPSTPVTVCNISNAIGVVCGASNTMALLVDGTVRIWGLGLVGRLGIGTTATQSTAVTPCNISNVAVVRSDFMRGMYEIEPATSRTVASLMLDTNYAFNAGSAQYLAVAVVGVSGYSEYQRDGSSTWISLAGVSPTAAVVLRGADSIRGSYGSVTLKAWNGMGVSGALTGVDTTVSGATVAGYAFGTGSLVTSVVFKRPITYRSIACGAIGHTAALLADGTMRTWGNNGNGQLGIGSTASQLAAVTPCNVSNVISIACGPLSTAALLADGTMRIWGGGSNGALGIGSTADMSRAVTPCNVSNVVAIACGDSHTAALLADGTMRTWGFNGGGCLGIGSTIDMSTAVTPCNVSNVVAIGGGGSHIAALLADGTMRTWGGGSNGALGIGSTADMSRAVTPCNVSNVVAIASTHLTTAALLADGTMRTWGSNNVGRLGIGSTVDMSTAVTPCNISNAIAIILGGYCAALLADGTMRTWGFNGGGRLGIGSTIDMSTAVTPCNVSNVVAIGGGGSHIAALLADGTMRTWGSGFSGRLGINSIADMSRAVTPWTAAGNSAPLSNISIVTPNIQLGAISTYANAFNLATILNDLSNAYQPGLTAQRGIAIVGSSGTWEYSTNSGSTWTSLGAVSAVSATLLVGSTAVRLRSTVPATDTLSVKAWNAQHLSLGSALVLTGIDTTTTGTTLLAKSFGTSTVTLNNMLVPAPAVPTITGVAGGMEKIDVSFSITDSRFVSGYTIDVSGVGTYNVASSPATVGGIVPGTYAVRVRAYNLDLSASDYSTSATATVVVGVAKTYRSIGAGNAHTGALLADGTVSVWGSSSSGQLGNGSTVDMSTAVTSCNISNALSIAFGNTYTAALLTDGTLRMWGSGGSGCLGIGNTVQQTTAVTPCNINNAVAVALGSGHSAAILSDGTVRVWGNNGRSQLGIGSTTSQLQPVTVCNISNAVAIACGNDHTGVVLANGTVRMFGNGFYGSFGNQNYADMSTAVTPCNISNVVSIACGTYHTAMLLADGTMRTCGWGANGRLGINSTVDMSVAVTPCNISNVVAIACGASNTAALIADGTMRTWGDGSQGRLGIGTTVSQAMPVTPCNVSNAVAIMCGAGHIGALLADGTMRVWGWNNAGRLGIGSTVDMSRAVTPWTSATNSAALSNISVVKPSFKLASVAIYNNYPLNLALADVSAAFQPGTTADYGLAIVGASGTWQYSSDSGSSWTTLGAVSAASAVTLAASSAVRIRSSTAGVGTLTVKAWNGMQATPALVTTGVDTTVATATIQGYSFSAATYSLVTKAQPTPAAPTLIGAVGGDTVIDVSFSMTSTAFVDGYTVDVSGLGTYNATGSSPVRVTDIAPGTYAVRIRAYNADGASAYSSSATVTVVLNRFTTYNTISAGYRHTATVLADGTIRTWGAGVNGKLGIGSTTQQNTPVTVCNISNAITVVTGSDNTAALLADGTVRTWGYNADGELGIGTITSQTTPVTPCNLSNVVAIAIAPQGMHFGAVLANGTMRTWGYGATGQLGINSTTSQTQPATPWTSSGNSAALSNVVAVACSFSHTVALLVDGTLRTWGEGTQGKLGIGSTTQQNTAVTPCNISNVISVACGFDHTTALLANGTVMTWGAGTYGKLGIGSTADMSRAVTVCNISNAIAIACGDENTITLLADGTVRTWGRGFYGAIGNNLTVDMSRAVTPCNISNAIGITCGTRHLITLLADGTMREWGNNDYGQLGINSLTQQTTAVTPWTSATNSAALSNISVVKPSFKLANLATTVNLDLSNIYFLNINTGYQPGTVPYRGIAVTATTGTWQYSTDSGSTWTTINGVTASSALAIRLEPTVRIKCTAAGVLTVKAWSAQQATPATVTSAVDTTVATATIQGYSFAASTTTITAA